MGRIILSLWLLTICQSWGTWSVAPGQGLPETLKNRPPYMVDLQKEIPTLKWKPMYALPNNPTGKRLYPRGCRPWGCKKLAEALKTAVANLEKIGLGIVVFDAYRPHSTTIKLWNAARRQNLPDNTYACPWGTSPHNRGAAVDVSLYSLSTGRELKMPSKVDEFSKEPTNTDAKENANLLETAMVDAGFKPHLGEWWHFEIEESVKNPPGDWTP